MSSQKNNFDEIDILLFDYYNKNKDIPKDTEKMLKNISYQNKKLPFSIGKVAIILVSFFTLTTGLVFGKDIVSFLQNIFELSSINVDNDNITNAVANKNYIQILDDEYTQINSDYKFKIDYLLIDDVNLYMVFNLCSNKTIDENYRISIIDLLITDENNQIIYDSSSPIHDKEFVVSAGWKKIDNDSQNPNYKKELLFLVSNGFPIIRELNVSFNTLVLYDNRNPTNNSTINCNYNNTIQLSDKFINRESYEFCTFEDTANYTLTKCIATDTGTYIILNTSNPTANFNLLINGTIYNSTKHLLGMEDGRYVILYQYNITKDNIDINNTIKLQDNSGIILNISK